MAAMAAILKIYFVASSPKHKKRSLGSATSTNRSSFQTPRGRANRQIQTSTNRTNVRKALRLALSSKSEVIAMPEGLKNTRWDIKQTATKLVGSIEVTYRSKIAKLVPIENPRWQPWRPSWKSIFRFFTWTERPVDLELGRKLKMTCRSKIAKSSRSEIKDGCLGGHLENLFAVPKLKKPIDSKLSRKRQVDV